VSTPRLPVEGPLAAPDQEGARHAAVIDRWNTATGTDGICDDIRRERPSIVDHLVAMDGLSQIT
jgi:hypothetical protein